MKITLREEAVVDLESIHAFIAKDSPRNAKAVHARIWASIGLLSTFPQIGRTSEIADIHELPVRGLPYIIVYQIDEGRRAIIVLNVVHGARER